jgi:Fic family protein
MTAVTVGTVRPVSSSDEETNTVESDDSGSAERLRLQRVEHVTDELRELLAETSEHCDELSAQLAEARKRRDGYQRALRQLTGEESPAAAAKPKQKPDQNWVPSERRLAQVWEAVRARDGVFSVSETAAVAGVANDTARRALLALRERELVRLTATRGQGGGQRYAVMPGAAEREVNGAA